MGIKTVLLLGVELKNLLKGSTIVHSATTATRTTGTIQAKIPVCKEGS